MALDAFVARLKLEQAFGSEEIKELIRRYDSSGWINQHPHSHHPYARVRVGAKVVSGRGVDGLGLGNERRRSR